MAVLETAAVYRPTEHHSFQATGRDFVYLVSSAAIFELQDLSKDLFDLLLRAPGSRGELVGELSRRGYPEHEISSTLDEMEGLGVIWDGEAKQPLPVMPEKNFPLQRIVLNTTNQCNLACGYCYEYSDDKIAATQGKSKFMSEEVAFASIDTLFQEAAWRPGVHVTFFGGETLLNYPVMKAAVNYARRRGEETGKKVDFSLTTNATLLTEEIVDFLAENRIGVTVSMDGDRELHDKMRVFHNGKGSYDVIVPKIKMLLARHRTNSIGARVTLSSGVRHVRRIYEHLTQEIGFMGVGFSPATANPDRLYHIGEPKMDDVMEQFAELAWEYRDFAVRGGQHYFTNANDTIKELHSGINKAYTCGAGLGMVGVGTTGDVAVCHRFVDAPVGQLGNVLQDGIDQTAREEFLKDHSVSARPDCHTCWVRPVCAGGCYHEAYIHHGQTNASSLHQCDRVRGWIDTCLQIYGEITVKNPEFLDRFETLS